MNPSNSQSDTMAWYWDWYHNDSDANLKSIAFLLLDLCINYVFFSCVISGHWKEIRYLARPR